MTDHNELEQGAKYIVTEEFARWYNNPPVIPGKVSFRTFYLKVGHVLVIDKRRYDEEGTVTAVIVGERAITVPLDKIALLQKKDSPND